MDMLPWFPDRTLTARDASAAIATYFPEVDTRTVKHMATGWEFDVYLTGDDWVFRFPRRDWIAGLFLAERRVHDLVSPILAPIAVPTVELLGEPSESFPHEFAGHRFIAGVPADVVAPHLEATLAREIGSALEAIHSIALEDARAAGLVEMDVDEPGRRDWLRRGLDRAPGLRGLEPSIEPALEWLAGVSLPFPEYEGPLRVVHHGLSPANLLVDPQTGRLTGILDWTDTFLGDPVRDFADLVMWRGWGFTDDVLRGYHLPLDEGFRDRVSFAARLLSTVVLTEAHAHGMDVATYVNGVRNAFA
jgi:aminoglycoside phosphotransferase (APT) family kinase protein